MVNLTEAFTLRLASLNEEQRKVVETTEGPVLVVAGPGSGKTETLALRTAYIIKENLASASQILCLTFTDNAAINMRKRLETLIGVTAYKVNIFTFHSFCNHLISRYPEYFYNAAQFSLANDIIRAEIMEALFKKLPHKHVFASFHPTEGFVYLKDVRDRIKHIKSGGYTADEFLTIVTALEKEYEPLSKILASWPEGRLSIKTLNTFSPILSLLKKEKSATGILLAKTLDEVIKESEAIGKTEPLSSWKKKYLHTDDDGVVLKDTYNLPKLFALADLYKSYEQEMYKRGHYDYDDMIIEVSHALKKESVLRSEIEEQYQYILVDEFQDTNEAQMGLIHAITQSVYHEGKPNVLVVGDDDQAIYKFQGAEVSHIIHFRDKTYKDVRTVVLDKNYRSTEAILALARTVITQGKVRLENNYDDIHKIMQSMNTDLPKGSIDISLFGSDVEEYSFVAQAIKKAIKEKEAPEEIAIIAREHKQLQALLPYLDQAEIPYEYIKKANVFDEPHIKELILLSEYASSILTHAHTHDNILPKILSFPFWYKDKEEASKLILNVAYNAKRQNIPWLEALEKNGSPAALHIHETITTFVQDAQSLQAPHALEALMEKSGFKKYYFTDKKNDNNYITFLASLKTFFEGLREYKQEEQTKVEDIVPFVELHKAYGIPLVSDSLFTKSDHCVKLLTAHASKGLEFGRVFIISAHDDAWTKAPRTNKAPLPSVLAPLLTPAGDNEDDFIRLLYVAITRAKHSLHITTHNSMVRFLATEGQEIKATEALPITTHETSAGLLAPQAINGENTLLKKLVEEYSMSATHFLNFLNIKDCGPLLFVETNLLAFPQPTIPAAVYGSAIHKALDELITYARYHGGEKTTLEHILAVFKKELGRGRLNHTDHDRELKRGEALLPIYYEKMSGSFLGNEQVEVDMRDEGVVVGNAHLTGKIDLLRTEEGGYHVIDFKTGSAVESFDEVGLSDYEKIKVHNYKIQLIFYKLLLENSKHYKHDVAKLAIEFVESIDSKANKPLTLIYEPTQEEIDRVTKLIEIVYKKIKALDFPDTAIYDQSYKGILQFEEDLLKGSL